jgi:uncharacterized repeat protein (TIGR03803 family)
MKTHINNLFLLSCAGLVLMLAGRVTAQTFTTLHSFNAISDGAYPRAGLILSGNTLYGTAQNGGSSGNGTVFVVYADGTGFSVLHNFTNNPDGANPYAGLVLSGNTLYGTAEYGGSSGNGTAFAINTNGTGFTNLHSFTALASSGPSINSDGARPVARLILSGNTLYGTAEYGGSGAYGTVFAVNADGTGFTNLHDFSYWDGANPYAGLVLSGNTLYGTTGVGGSSGNGTVFAINTNGTGFTVLHNFTNNPDGATPFSGLILSGNTLYGTTVHGGSSGKGTVFAINTNGTGFTSLHSFAAIPFPPGPYTNSDGATPLAGLILSGSTLYGTTTGGGSSGNGTVFAINTNGTGFTNLHDFTYSDGVFAQGGLVLSGNTLYGTAMQGGTSGNGTVFSISFTPQLTITPSGANVILTWPTNVAGFDYTGYILQSATNLFSPVWNPVSPPPTVVNGQNAVTNPISGSQQFFRLGAVPPGMALILAGSFTMGNQIINGNSITNDPDITDANPTNVYVSAFYMDVNLVSYDQWQAVYNWATNHGYSFVNPGNGKAVNHPVQTVSWYDCVKWSNARSAQAGLTPVYYTDAGFTQVYSNGAMRPYVNWTASGYRLPTEAEWEKAARGGLSGQRFPWGNTISESQANYRSDQSYNYDLGPVGYNAIGSIGGTPYTSPVGSFAPNGYGLSDMAGNLGEWCWDWYGTHYGRPTTNNPTGPPSGTSLVRRGGQWTVTANLIRCAVRNTAAVTFAFDTIGFRCVSSCSITP